MNKNSEREKMIRITIGSSERQLKSSLDLDESWINQQINRRREDGQQVCVKVKIRTDSLDFTLATPTCEGLGGRRPKPHEQEIFDLWKKRGLDKKDFTGGNLVAFIKQLKRLLS